MQKQPRAADRDRSDAASRDHKALADGLPSAALMQLCMGLRASQALFVATQLGVADYLAEQALTSTELAALAQTHPASLRRLLRALTALGVFADQGDDRFTLTAIGQLLRRDHPRSLRSRVLFLAGEVRWRCWADLLGSVRSGDAAAERVLGMPLFDYYATHLEESAIHDAAMAEASALTGPAILRAYDFSCFQTVVDVGGGSGQLLRDILRTNPTVRGVLFDLPHVVARAPSLMAAAGVGERCQILGGSFFEVALPGADAHLLKQVVHDWDDQGAAGILAACRRVMPHDGTLLLIERVLPEHVQQGEALDAYLIDLEMLAMTPGGRERTANAFRALLAGAGFVLARVIPTGSSLSIIEAHPM